MLRRLEGILSFRGARGFGLVGGGEGRGGEVLLSKAGVNTWAFMFSFSVIFSPCVFVTIAMSEWANEHQSTPFPPSPPPLIQTRCSNILSFVPLHPHPAPPSRFPC